MRTSQASLGSKVKKSKSWSLQEFTNILGVSRFRDVQTKTDLFWLECDVDDWMGAVDMTVERGHPDDDRIGRDGNAERPALERKMTLGGMAAA